MEKRRCRNLIKSAGLAGMLLIAPLFPLASNNAQAGSRKPARTSYSALASKIVLNDSPAVTNIVNTNISVKCMGLTDYLITLQASLPTSGVYQIVASQDLGDYFTNIVSSFTNNFGKFPKTIQLSVPLDSTNRYYSLRRLDNES